VQALLSSQVVAVLQAQEPPAFVQRYVVPAQEIVWHSVWVEASQA
jgi:hypothetical protein